MGIGIGELGKASELALLGKMVSDPSPNWAKRYLETKVPGAVSNLFFPGIAPALNILTNIDTMLGNRVTAGQRPIQYEFGQPIKPKRPPRPLFYMAGNTPGYEQRTLGRVIGRVRQMGGGQSWLDSYNALSGRFAPGRVALPPEWTAALARARAGAAPTPDLRAEGRERAWESFSKRMAAKQAILSRYKRKNRITIGGVEQP